MLRVRSIAVQCARELARSTPIARGVGESRGPYVVVRALTDSSHPAPPIAPQGPTQQLQTPHDASPGSEKLEPRRVEAVAEVGLKGSSRDGGRPKQWDVSCCSNVAL